MRFPELLDVVDSMRRMAWQMAVLPATARQSQQTRFLVLEGRLDAIVTGIESDYREAFSASPPLLKVRLEPGKVALAAALRAFRVDSLCQAGLATGAAAAPTDAAIEAVPLAPVIVALHAAWTVSQTEMERPLQVRNDAALHRMWLHLGTALPLIVEWAQEVQVLQDAGCDELQSFYFARPMPADAFSAWLLEHRAEVM